MAVSTSKRLSEVIRFWYATRVAGLPYVGIQQLQTTYWNSLGFAGKLGDQERKFYRKIITDQGKTPSVTPYISTLVKEAVSAIGVVPSVRLSENLMKLYTNYNP